MHCIESAQRSAWQAPAGTSVVLPRRHCDGPIDERNRTEATMGDRSPKSKQRDQKQKNAAKATDAAAARSKQDAQSHAPLPNQKGKR
jgi:hypothetical protein